MVDSVNQNIGTPTTPGTPVTGDNPVDEVGLGYSDSNTQSHFREEDRTNRENDRSVELDSPAVGDSSSKDFQKKAFNSRLAGFRAVVSDFNARFNAGDVDLADTHTLLLVIKGMVSDTRAMISAESIDQAAGNNALLQKRRQAAAKGQKKIKEDIQERQSTIDEAKQQKSNKSGELTQKKTSESLKKSQLAEATNQSDNNRITQLKDELSVIESNINQLEDDIVTLSDSVRTLESRNSSDRSSLALIKQVDAGDFVNIRQTINRVKERYDPEAIATGEENVRELKRKNRDTEVQMGREDMRLRTIKKDLKSIDKEVQDREIATDRQTKTEVKTPFKQRLLNPAELKTLSALVLPEDPGIILEKLKESPDQPTNEQFSEVLEGLALVLQAEPPPKPGVSKTASEENPVDQPFLGDNLSLEGANNPQAFALLMIQQNREQLQENVSTNDQLQALEALQTSQVVNMLEELKQVDAMVAEALEEAEMADAVIRRSPV